MDTTTPYAVFAHADEHHDAPRVSHEPTDGYVLNPWSGLYQETETTYRTRLGANQAM